jgi:uncharacterized membrane protein YfcA
MPSSASSPLLFYAMTALVGFIIGVSKGGLGGTAGALATPLMALVMPADQAIGLLLPILMFADIFAVALHWKRWNGRLVWLLIPGSVLGVTIGTYFITNAPTRALQVALGVIVLLFALYKLFEGRILKAFNYQARNWHGLVAGTISGFSSALAHTGGPPVSIYLLMQDVTPQVFIATSAIFFLILNWIKVPYYWYAGLFDFQLLWQIAWLLPVVPIGVWVGKWAAGRVNKETYERVIVVLLLITGVMLVVGL